MHARHGVLGVVVQKEGFPSSRKEEGLAIAYLPSKKLATLTTSQLNTRELLQSPVAAANVESRTVVK